MSKKIKIKSEKGFTLIELMMVIAIIGIVASIVMVNLGGVRTKAKDASIISSAKSIVTAAMIDAVSTQDYAPYYDRIGTGITINSADDCFSYFNSTLNPAQVRAACSSIIESMGSATPANGKMFIGSWYVPGSTTTPKLSIMVYLPGAQKYYCMGSNSRTSKTTELSGIGCGGSWVCPGCVGDPVGNGS